jgi:hypothetical protein
MTVSWKFGNCSDDVIILYYQRVMGLRKENEKYEYNL